MLESRDDSVVEVRTTKLGNAVFASCDITAEEIVGIITGEMVYGPDSGSEYCIDLGDDEGLEPTAPFRYLNHSCEPNCELWIYECDVSGEKEVQLVAMKPIASGDELSIDYAWAADSAIPCLCGTKQCRGWIVSPEELHVLMEKDIPTAAV